MSTIKIRHKVLIGYLTDTGDGNIRNVQSEGKEAKYSDLHQDTGASTNEKRDSRRE